MATVVRIRWLTFAYSGFMHLAAGLSVGLTGMAAGYAIGVVGDMVWKQEP